MDAFQTWLQTLEKNGVKPEDAAAIFNGVSKVSALQLYSLLLASLTNEDIAIIDAIPDDKDAEAKIKELFQKRTNLTVEEVAKKAQEGFFEKYLEESGKNSSQPPAIDE
jgi:hypothetical protein